MPTTITIDLVADISCPWCIIGYKSLECALENLASEINADIHWHPFELNQDMSLEGQKLDEYLLEKYGISTEQSQENRNQIRSRGAQLGIEFNYSSNSRIYNTFDAHRLLFWAKEQSKQHVLHMALFDLYFTHGGNPSDHNQLVETAIQVGLDGAEALKILTSDRYKKEVRQEQAEYAQLGIRSVPTVIFNNQYVITGGQTIEAFEKVLSNIVSEIK